MTWTWWALCSLLALTGLAGGDSAPAYYAVCDAGSTGTRLYIFLLDTAAGKAKSVFVKKTKPGLSSYKESPGKAVAPLLALLKEGAKEVPAEVRATTPLLIYGTAGMRLLPLRDQSKIWATLSKDLVSAEDFPFDRTSFSGRTVDGDEEGLWAVLTTNFLTGRMGHDLVSHGLSAPLGLLDLGGSSTQIGIPSPEAAKKGINFSSGVLVRSYLGFGMTHIQKKVRAIMGEDLSCFMPDTRTEDGPLKGHNWGNADICRHHISEILRQESESCKQTQTEQSCLGDLSGNEDGKKAIKGDVNFYGVSGLTYVADFVRWWLASNNLVHALTESFPTPTLEELESAVDVLCKSQYSGIYELTQDKATAHKYTDMDNLPYRCFQANYILVLLGEIYGFDRESRKVTFALEVEGEDLEWPLGALLHERATSGATEAASEL
mmetsp:Transcript_43894/g.102578  ORF Transcript_43894/g.102578 Transcript_43894/m.102578 type:complete len:434 (+) Transcript_43894:102-1403(+)